MRNPATVISHNDFNSFTELLYLRIYGGQRVLVKLRDGRITPVMWHNGTEDEPDSYFFYNSESVYFIWNKDGTSITQSAFDIMEDLEN